MASLCSAAVSGAEVCIELGVYAMQIQVPHRGKGSIYLTWTSSSLHSQSSVGFCACSHEQGLLSLRGATAWIALSPCICLIIVRNFPETWWAFFQCHAQSGLVWLCWHIYPSSSGASIMNKQILTLIFTMRLCLMHHHHAHLIHDPLIVVPSLCFASVSVVGSVYMLFWAYIMATPLDSLHNDSF